MGIAEPSKTGAAALSSSQAGVVAGTAVATYLGVSMGSAVSMVLPQVASDLHASAAQIQWIISGFLLARIAMLRPAGMLCDAFGAGPIFVLGIAGFALASGLCAGVSEQTLLVALRIAQGVFAALLSPSALVLLRVGVPVARQPWAMSIWSTAGVAGFGLSPVLGGLLVNAWGWRSMFVFTALLSLLIGGLALRRFRATRATPAQPSHRAAPASVMISSAVLATLAFFVGQNDLVALLAVVGAALALLGLLGWRGKVGAEAWRLGLRILPQIGIGLIGFMAIAGCVLWASYFIQSDLRRGAMVFGFGCLPMAAIGVAASFRTGSMLAAKKGRRAFLLAGLSVLALGCAAFGAETGQSLVLAVLALACAGACYGSVNASVTSGVMSAFPADESGNASTIATLSKQFGQLIGITVVAAFRDLSGARPGDDHRLFYFFLACGVAMVLCAGLGAGRRDPKK